MSKVLIVDDSTDSRAFCELIASMLNVKVEKADCVDQAIMALDAGLQPDLILLDLIMPGRAPGELVKRVKEDPTLSGTRIVIMSTMREIHEMATAIGADYAMMKPLDMAKFADQLRPYSMAI